MAAARGARVVEPGGRELIDLFCGSGAVILGHAHPGQVAAVREAVGSGATVSLRHPREPELAGHLVELCPGATHAALFKTGSEAVHAAITTAVKATGRRAVLTTSYHGWLLPLGELSDLGGFRVERLDWRSPALAARVAALAGEAACLVVTPTTDTVEPDAVRAVVDAARAGGAVVIFDEVKSGFRFAYPTVSAAWGIPADLTVVSKGIGNGFPIAALLGSDLLASTETFSVYSTYASELVSVAAALECLRALADGGYERFARNSTALYEALRDIGGKYNVGVSGVPTFFRLDLPASLDSDDLCRRLYERGVLYHPLDQVLVSAAHGPEEIERVCAVFESALEA
ncbi:glutamate-1-semialdehyde 2,1-aminomutase [Virgisporangium aliadipatigenens]|uniref:Glutamate-1-semialdehyde 2,1-aminomutase n=2 Tax=Virgisporangium aliadipatigenens TaxID=741659 RepID=A0A8J3YWL5_9ACTN|nr:glutamate-1-semialdehyde 2,1-aminomutase [Virgisporangium aliadipatigenens]